MKRTDSKAATREYERRRWAIGDAIAQDIAESSDFDFRECSRALMARGYDYDERRLRRLHRAAAQFAPADRLQGISWEIHEEAGDPETLKRIIEALREAGEPIKLARVQGIMRLWRAEQAEG